MQKIKITKKRLILTTAILLVVGGTGLFAFSRSDSRESPNETKEYVNYDPPTENEKTESEDNKNNVTKRQDLENQKSPTMDTKTVTPIITSYGQTSQNVEVAARVPGIYEEGGTCTLILTKGSQRATGTSKSIKNVSETSCGFIKISRSRLAAGSWTATVSYGSAVAKGISQPQTIEVK